MEFPNVKVSEELVSKAVSNVKSSGVIVDGIKVSGRLLDGFGCSSCHYRNNGCPYGIKNGEVISGGICDWKVEQVVFFLAGEKNSKRVLRDIHLVQLQESVMYLRKKLLGVMSSGPLSKEESKLWELLLSWDKELAERRDRAIRTDDAKKVNDLVVNVLSPVDVAVMIRQRNSLIVDADVVS